MQKVRRFWLFFILESVFVLFPQVSISPASGQADILETVGEQYPIQINNQTFVVHYGYGGSFEVGQKEMLASKPNLLSMSLDQERKSLILEFEQLIEADLFWIRPPPELISAEEQKFQVFVDGKETKFDIVIYAKGTRIGFILPPNAENVEIIGTRVIPEFGTISIVILAASTMTSMFFLRTRNAQLIR